MWTKLRIIDILFLKLEKDDLFYIKSISEIYRAWVFYMTSPKGVSKKVMLFRTVRNTNKVEDLI